MRAYAFTYLVATVLVAVLCAHNAFAQEAPPAQPQPQVPVPEQAQVPAAATPAQPQPQVPEQVPVPVPAEAPAVVAPASATAAAAAGPQKTVGTLSAIELAEFRTELKAVFLSDNDGPGTSAGGPPMMRSLVRLGFHDCASETCDGCIDADAGTTNAGLDVVLEVLAPMCVKHSLSTADCISTAASMAVEELSAAGPTQARMPLFFGRMDSATCGNFTDEEPEGVFPAGQDGVEPTFSYFLDNFGLTERETVALMGAHSLGRAEPEGSGFEGAWTLMPNTFDNGFYTDMLAAGPGWAPDMTDAELWQWTSSSGEQLMLNSDMSLIMDPFSGGTETSGEPTCTYATCPTTPTRTIAEEFAADNELFITEFVNVYVKVMTKGYDVCEMTVVPSSGSGPEVEALYGITAFKQACAGSSSAPAAAQGPAASGELVFQGTISPTEAAAAASAPITATDIDAIGPSTADIDANGATTTSPSSTDTATAPVTDDEGTFLDDDSALSPEDGVMEVAETTSAAFATATGQGAYALMIVLGLAAVLL